MLLKVMIGNWHLQHHKSSDISCRYLVHKVLEFGFEVYLNLWQSSNSWHRIRSFTVATFASFSATFCFTFWLLFEKWDLKMTWKWRQKGAFLQNGPIPPILQSGYFSCSFCFHFVVPFLLLFQTQLWHLCVTISMPTHLHLPHWLIAATPSFLPLTLYHQHNSITTHCHHSHACYQACTSHE